MIRKPFLHVKIVKIRTGKYGTVKEILVDKSQSAQIFLQDPDQNN